MNKEITVTSESVYDARSLAELVALVNSYSSSVKFIAEGRCVNAKSIMGVMGFGLDKGKNVMIEAVGQDEAEAIAGLEAFLGR